MFNKMKREMLKVEPSINEQEIEGSNILVARRSCSQLESKLANIEFMLQNTKIIIKPRGYLYNLQSTQKDCFIGISSLPDNTG